MRTWHLSVPLLASIALLPTACGSRTPLFADDTFYQGSAANDGGADAQVKPLTCTPGQFTLTRASAQLVFVLDRSGSMQFTLAGRNPSSSEPSKWDLLRDALSPVLFSLEKNIEVGAKFFPRFNTDDPSSIGAVEACQVDDAVDVVPVKGTSAQKIVDVFGNTHPVGGTPTSDALRAAAAYLSSPQRRSVSRFIVLATDGAPNCNGKIPNPESCVCTATDPTNCRKSIEGQYSCLDDTRTIASLRDIAGTQRIPTYVLGLGSPERPEFVDTLDQMAVAGERARPEKPFYYDIRTSDQLSETLASIQKSVSRCSFVTPSRPDDPDSIDITVDGKTIPHDGKEGWDWIDRDFGQIGFFGDVCAALATAGESPSVSATVTCKTH